MNWQKQRGAPVLGLMIGMVAWAGMLTGGHAQEMRSVRIAGNENARAIELENRQVRVKGLLVMDLGGNQHAGGTSEMVLSALAGAADDPATVGFNQPVGRTMANALVEVVKFIEIRHGGWPRGHAMEISFQDKYYC